MAQRLALSSILRAPRLAVSPVLRGRQQLARGLQSSPRRAIAGPEATISEQAVKADKYTESPEELQKRTATEHSNQRRTDRETAAGNAQPTESEDTVRGSKHDKTPQELQKETASKMQGS